MENIEKIIYETMQKISEENQFDLDSNLNNQSVLLESGIDSLGFAILVAELDDILGFDPFIQMEEPIYPNTLGEFISIYERFNE